MPKEETGWRCVHCRKFCPTEEDAAACELHHEQAGKVYAAAVDYLCARDLSWGTVITITLLPSDQLIRVVTPQDSGHPSHGQDYEIRPSEVTREEVGLDGEDKA